MGHFLSIARRTRANNSKNMKARKEKKETECIVLLLGISGAGKTSLLKHMKDAGAPPDDVEAQDKSVPKAQSERVAQPNRHYHGALIRRITLGTACNVVLAMRELKLDFISRKNESNAACIMNQSSDDSGDTPHADLSDETAQAIHELWHDASVIEFIKQKHGSELVQGADYFLSEVIRIASPTYTPSHADIQNLSRMGITDTVLPMSSKGKMRVFEIDSDGKSLKWLPYFENVTTIIFCAPLIDYDQVSDGRKVRFGGQSSTLSANLIVGQNRMAESLQLFESVVNDPNFHQTSVVLFLTRISEFKTKLPRVSLERYFPDYRGGADINKGAKYILWRYMQANRAHLSVYPHLANVTDKTNVRLLYSAVKETMLRNLLRKVELQEVAT